MSQLSHEKRTRSQLTIDQSQQNLDQSPLKLARTAARTKLNKPDEELKATVGRAMSAERDNPNDDEDDEILLSPNKRQQTKTKPRFMSPAKRPSSPFQGSSRTSSEEREPKRTKRGPGVHAFGHDRMASITNIGSPPRAESAAPESPIRLLSSSRAPPNTATRAQSMPVFLGSQSLPDVVVGYGKDGIPRLNLAHPSLSPSRHRSASPERTLKILPSKASQLDSIADDEDFFAREQSTASPRDTHTRPLAPALSSTSSLETPRAKTTVVDLGSPLTPVPATPWTISKGALREQLLKEAMAKDLADSEKNIGRERLKVEESSPSIRRKKKKPWTNSTGPPTVKHNPKPPSVLKFPTASSSGSTPLSNLAKDKPANDQTKSTKELTAETALGKRKSLAASSTAAAVKARKSTSGKASSHYPREDKRSLLGRAAKSVTRMSINGRLRPKVKQVAVPVAKVQASKDSSLDAGPSKPQPKILVAGPLSIAHSASQGEMDTLEDQRPEGYSRESSLTPLPTESELTDLPSSHAVTSPPVPSIALPAEDSTTVPVRPTSDQPDVPSAVADQTTPKAAPSKAKVMLKDGKKPSKPSTSTSQPRVTRSSSLRKKPADESALEVPPQRSRVSSIPKLSAKNPFGAVDAANELLRMAGSSAPPISPFKKGTSPPKLSRQSSAPGGQFSSRFLGKNGEPSALDNLNRALAKLKAPPPPRPASSAGFNRDKLDDHDKAGTSKGESSNGAARKSSIFPSSSKEPSAKSTSSNSVASSSKSSGKIDSYFKPKPFLPAGSGTGRGTMPRSSLAPNATSQAKDVAQKKPQGFARTVQRAKKVSKQPTLPRVEASPVKGGGGYVEYEMDLPDESMELVEIVQVCDIKGKGKETGTPRKSAVGLMGPPELPSNMKEEPESPFSEQSAGPSKSRRKTDEFPTVSSDSADILSDCVAFVDVRTENGDSAGEVFAEMLQNMGARVLKAVGQTCTHIIYKDGLASTTNKWRALPEPKPKVVSLMWVAACAEQGMHVDEETYLLDLTNVNLAGITKKRRSILPKIFGQDFEDSKKARSPPSDADVSLDSANDDGRPPSRTKRRSRA